MRAVYPNQLDYRGLLHACSSLCLLAPIQTEAAEDRIHSDCINLGTKSHEEEAIERNEELCLIGTLRALI